MENTILVREPDTGILMEFQIKPGICNHREGWYVTVSSEAKIFVYENGHHWQCIKNKIDITRDLIQAIGKSIKESKNRID